MHIIITVYCCSYLKISRYKAKHFNYMVCPQLDICHNISYTIYCINIVLELRNTLLIILKDSPAGQYKVRMQLWMGLDFLNWIHKHQACGYACGSKFVQCPAILTTVSL